MKTQTATSDESIRSSTSRNCLTIQSSKRKRRKSRKNSPLKTPRFCSRAHL